MRYECQGSESRNKLLRQGEGRCVARVRHAVETNSQTSESLREHLRYLGKRRVGRVGGIYSEVFEISSENF